MKLTPANEEKVNAAFARLAPKFKPEFGNEQHIRLCALLARAGNNDKLLKKHIEEANMVNTYRKKVFDTKLSAINQLKYIMKETEE